MPHDQTHRYRLHELGAEPLFDPTSIDPAATHGIPIPTYGNYGGPGYTAGTLGGTTPSPPPNPPPVDALDALFYVHDLAFQQFHDGTIGPAELVEASVQLVLGMSALTYTDPVSPDYDPAAGLYEGLGTLAVVSQLLVGTGAFQTLPSPIQQQITTATQEAVTNFEAGLAAIPGEAGSLHGALHVFEHKFAESLPFDLMF
jgi:hypothetical protein